MNRSFLPHLCAVLLAGTAISSLVSETATAAPVGSLTQLGILPGDTAAFAFGLSADGTTVVGYRLDGVKAIASYWSASGGVSTVPIIADNSIVRAISGDNSTMVGGYDTFGVGTGAFVYYQGTVYDLTLANQTFTGNSADAVSADGSVVVGTTAWGGVNGHATMWNGPHWSNATDLGLLPTGTFSSAYGIDGGGTTIIGSGDKADGYRHAFYWQAGVMTELMSPDVRSDATAISLNGSTIVGSTNNAGFSAQRAISWTGPGYTTVTDLGTLGGATAYATAVNGDGSVIVGSAELADNSNHAFRYANGSMADLNDLLTGAGVNLGGVVLSRASGVSANGAYISATSVSDSYLVFYNDGIGGITSQLDQQASVDGLGQQRQALALQHDTYAGILTGDLDRPNQANDVGVFGLVGSVVGGVHGHLGLGHGFSIAGGLMDGTSSFGGADIGNGILGAVALRYDADVALGGFTPYAQLGGSLGALSNVTFTRDYSGGAGVGTTDGRLAALYARLGLSHAFNCGDAISLEAELGNRWLSTDAYAESFSATNPFPAVVAAGTDRQTVGKLGGSWTHPLSDSLDLTLRAALGATLASSSGLSVATTGFGVLSPAAARPVWAELGAHLDWAVTTSSSIDLYASAIVGQDSGNNAHVGAGYRFRF